METSTMQIRRLTYRDFEALKRMPTGIPDDYVLRIFPESVNKEAMYGAFADGQLAAVSAYTVFAGRYAVLGRLRTDERYRGQGIATRLMAELCRKIDDDPSLCWVGLATETNNLPVKHIADRLNMTHLSSFHSCVLTNVGGMLAFEGSGPSGPWKAVDHPAEKRRLLKSVSPRENKLHIFPYECYYPLPFEEALWRDDYLSQCICFQHKNRFVMLLPDEKGGSYLHMKYFWDDCFSQPALWRTVIAEAKQFGRQIWVDLPFSQVFPDGTGDCFSRSSWMCYGRKSPQSI